MSQPPKKERRVRPLLQKLPANQEDAKSAARNKLARALGSVDYQTREKGVQALTRFLQRDSAELLDERDMMKIWKGLFYAFWHSDKQPVQEELAERLAAVQSAVKPKVAFLYYECFIRTMRREWFGIDRLRLDKFLMLIRKFVGQQFKVLADSKWQKPLVTAYMQHLHDHVLFPSDSFRALGIAYHLSDIFLPELKRVVAGAAAAGANAAQAAVPAETLRLLLDPFCRSLAAADNQPFVTRIKEGVFDPLLQELRAPDDVQLLRHLDVQGLAADLFGMGALPATRSKNREALYALSAALERSQAKRMKKEAAFQEAAQDQGLPPASALPAAGAGGAAATAGQPGSSEAAAVGKAGGKKKRKAGDIDSVASASHTPAAVVGSDQSAPTQPAAAAAKAGSQAGTSEASAVKQKRLANGVAASSAAKKAKLIPGAGPGLRGDEAPEALAAQPQQQQAPAPSGSGRKGKAAGDKAAKGLMANGVHMPTAAASGPESGGSTPLPAGKGQQQQRKADEAGPSGKYTHQSPKKRVQINLQKNLYFDFGGPVPHPDVRTPVTARSKGGILKKHAAPHSAPSKSTLAKAQGAAAPKLANGVGSADKALSKAGQGRARAALFF